MKISGSVMTSAIMLGVFLFFVIQAIFFGPAARMMPLIVGIPGTALCFCQLLIELRTGDCETPSSAIFSGGELTIAAWLIAFIVSITVFGFSFGSPPMVTAYLYFVAKERLQTAMVAGLSCFVFLYVFFERLMNTQLFEGLLVQYLW